MWVDFITDQRALCCFSKKQPSSNTKEKNVFESIQFSLSESQLGSEGGGNGSHAKQSLERFLCFLSSEIWVQELIRR